MFVWIIVGIVIIVLVTILIFQELRNKACEAAKQGAGICNFALDQSFNKKKNKEKIISLLLSKEPLSNEEIRESIKVSSRSVVRYLDELEKEGKVTNTANSGRGVTYKIASGN